MCEALGLHDAWLASRPAMAGYTDVLGFATWPFERGQCALPEDLEQRLGGPRPTAACPPGTEPFTTDTREGRQVGCLGGTVQGGGRFATDDAGRVLEGWSTTEVEGFVVRQARFEAGREQLGLDWWWREGRPVLVGLDTFGADGHAVSRVEFDAEGRFAARIEYTGPFQESRRVTWFAHGPHTEVAIAEGEEEARSPRVVRERRLRDGEAGPTERWVAGSMQLARSDAFVARAHPIGQPPERCPDPSVLGWPGAWTRYSRAAVPVPEGVTRLRFPPGWIAVPGAPAGTVELLVEQFRADATAPVDPCGQWGGSGVRLTRSGSTWELLVPGLAETTTSIVSVVGVVVLPPGLTARVDEGLHAKSLAAVPGGELVPLRPDRGHAAWVFGPWLAQDSATTFRRNAGLPLFEGVPGGPDFDPGLFLDGVKVDTDRPAVAEQILADLRAAAPTVEACFDRVLALQPTADGTVDPYFTVRPDGTVGYVHVIRGWGHTGPFYRAPAKATIEPTMHCVEDAVRAMRFGTRESRDLAVQATVSLPTLGSQLGVPRP